MSITTINKATIKTSERATKKWGYNTANKSANNGRYYHLAASLMIPDHFMLAAIERKNAGLLCWFTRYESSNDFRCNKAEGYPVPSKTKRK